MAVSNNPNSARQKMINLMYLIFIAMMALNIPAEVLDGFVLVESSLRATTESSTKRNEQIKATLEMAYRENAAKVHEWYNKGVDVKKQSDDLFEYLEELKLRIVQEADGKNADINNIRNKDHLDAAANIMLSPITAEGEKLKERIDRYRTNMSEIVATPSKVAMFETILSTKPKSDAAIAHSWESEMFQNMPVAAVVTLLTKMQSDVRSIEGEVLSTLLTNVDEKDVRVNKIEALVIPKSQVVTSGTPFEAQLVLAAVDSTRQPEYYYNDRLLDSEWLTVPSGGVGEHRIEGKIVSEGVTYPFSTSYSVTASSATIAPTLMNFLYESIDNDLEIAMPGIPSGAVRASMEGHGSINKKAGDGNIWTVTGLDMARSPTVSVVLTANVGGRNISESKEFRVRPLPEPLPFISYRDANGTTQKFTGGTIAKRVLIEASGVQAAIDDGVLDVPHNVTGFTLTFVDGMGNSIPLVSNSSEFTQQQKDQIRNLARGKQFHISNVRALDPAGRPVAIRYSMVIIVN